MQQFLRLVAGSGEGGRALTAKSTFSAEHHARSLTCISVGEEDRARGVHGSAPWLGSLVRVGGEMGRLSLYLLDGGLVCCIPVRDLQ